MIELGECINLRRQFCSKTAPKQAMLVVTMRIYQCI